MYSTDELKKASIAAVSLEFGMLLMRINHFESGRVVETAIQQMKNPYFNALVILMEENTTETRKLLINLAMSVSQKVYLTATDDEIGDAVMSIAALIQHESLRRKGHVEYVWANDIFTKTPTYPGFIRLTPAGKEEYLKQYLTVETESAEKYTQ